MQPALSLDPLSPRDRLFQSDQDRHGCTVDACPSCGGRDIWPETIAVPYGLICRTCSFCGARVSVADDYPDAAIAAWNDEARKVALARSLGLKLDFVQFKEDGSETC